MAKELKFERKDHKEKEIKDPKGGSEKIVEETKKVVAENLGDIKELKKQEQALEKEEKQVAAIEKNAAALDKEIQAQIEEKKRELANPEVVVEKKVTKEEKIENKTEKKEKKWDLNPLNWARHIGTRALAGIAGLPSRVAAKAHHIIAKPQQILDKEFWKDLGKNIMKTPKAIWKTISGAVYRPDRGKEKLEDNFKDYGKTWGPDADDKNGFVRNAKKATWYAGKVAAPITGGVSLLPKFVANVNRGINHFIHEAFEGVRDSKFKRNPMKWNLKSWKFSKTKEAFTKAFSWNKKGIPAHGKSVDITHFSHKEEHKKAA